MIHDSILFLGHPVDTIIKQLLHCSRKVLKTENPYNLQIKEHCQLQKQLIND